MTPETHDAILVFSKTWGGLYLFVFFVAAAIWTYRPSHKKTYDKAAQAPLGDEEILR